MKIGILSPVNIKDFDVYFDEGKQILYDNCIPSMASAVHTLIHGFLAENHDVKIFTLSKHEDFVLKSGHLEIVGVSRENRYPIKYLWGIFNNSKRLSGKLDEYIQELDVLHAHWTYTYAHAASVVTKEIPVFCTVRDWAPYIWKIESIKNKISWSFRLLMNNLVFRNRKIHFIANSPYTQSLIKKKYKIDVPFIPNPIKGSFIKYNERVLPSSLELICISSSNDRRKNVVVLLNAFRILLSRYPQAHLSIIGAPFVTSNEIIGRWKKEKLLDQVSLLGSVAHHDLHNYLDRSRIFVAPSLEETFGNTLIEAMARKVPVVGGKDSGAVPYVLQEGEAGFLCDVTDALDLANTIEKVYINPELAKLKTEKAFDILTMEYLDRVVLNKHLELYKKILKS
ncbi:glycosyltransferase family 4 protein [Sphingobacterium sp. DN00404]|uniref:Glycosyltransferase family 4 protein n=1 Tax=Sphingobacterium micropteri TaxID=2763501 RepID=A0ABR7YKA7_9SPHI|nr:glycosyltransferase family 4 protein [Sphingobacterium micropteri]MBD1431744.1 glycosyltransferase family 4 protein [Sphingobacterium micropteri]